MGIGLKNLFLLLLVINVVGFFMIFFVFEIKGCFLEELLGENNLDK